MGDGHKGQEKPHPQNPVQAVLLLCPRRREHQSHLSDSLKYPSIHTHYSQDNIKEEMGAEEKLAYSFPIYP